MVREPDELVEMRRVLGAQLAAYRQAAALSQGQLAVATTVDRTTVTHIEKGRSRADERFWRIADERCRAGGVLLAGYRSWQAAKQQHDIRVTEANLADARARAESLRARHPSESLTGQSKVGSLTVDAPVPDAVIGQLARLLCGWIGAMDRRELLQLLGLAATAPPAVADVLDPDEQERLYGALAAHSRVDDHVIGHMAAMFRHCQLQEDALGSRAVLPIALGQQHLVRHLLTGCPAALRPRLLSTYSDISTSIAYYYFELNDIDRARLHHEQAWRAAREAEDTELTIYALGEWSYTESWQGKPQSGIELATAALSLVDRTDDPLMRVGAIQRAATAYAFNQQPRECIAKLESARAELDASTGKLTDESPAYFFNVGYLASHKSECLLRLNNPAQAAASARAGLRIYDKSFADGYAVCTLHLGTAHLQAGEIDEGARVIGDAAGLAARTRSARLINELRATRARLRPWTHTQAVRTLDETLHAHGLAPTP